jgi:hypothetical protein
MQTPTVTPMTHQQLLHERTMRRVRDSVLTRPVHPAEQTHGRQART